MPDDIKSQNNFTPEDVKREEQEKKEAELFAKKEQKRQKKMKKAFHLRKTKNFFLIFISFLMGIIFTVGSVALCFTVVPVGSLIGITGQNADKYVSEEVSKQSALSVIQNYNKLTVGDLPIVKDLVDDLVNSSGFVKVDVNDEGIDKLTIKTIDKAIDYVKLDSGILKQLGDIGDKLKDFGLFERKEVPANETPTGRFEPKAYYFYKNKGKENETFERAFDDNRDKLYGNVQVQLYYPSLSDVPITDLFAVIGKKIEGIYITDIVDTFIEGSSEIKDLVSSIFDGITVGEIDKFNYEDIKLDVVLPYEQGENDDLYKILFALVDGDSKYQGATVGDKYAQIKIGDLMKIKDINGLSLNAIIDEGQNAELYDILNALVPNPSGSDGSITVGDLMGIKDFNGIKISTFVAYDQSTKDLYEILYSACGATYIDTATENKYEQITVGDLSNVKNFDGIKIATFVDYNESTKDLFEVLYGACGATYTDTETESKYEQITVGDISKVKDFDSIKIKTFIDYDESTEELFEILYNASGATYTDTETESKYEQITVGDISKIKDFGEVPLDTIIAEKSNKDLYEILNAIVEATGDYKSGSTERRILFKDLDNITSEDFKKIKLTTVMAYDQTTKDLYKIIYSAIDGEAKGYIKAGTTDADYDKITVGDLEEVAGFDNVPLSTFISEEGHEDIYNVIRCIAIPQIDENEEILFKHFKNLSTDLNNVRVTLFLNDPVKNARLLEILFEAIDGYEKEGYTDQDGNPIYDKITVGNLIKISGFDNVSISEFIPETGNSQMYDILRNLLGKDAESKILVGDFNGKKLDFNNVAITNIISEQDHAKLFGILFDAISGYTKAGYTDGSGNPIYSKMTIGDLVAINGFDTVPISQFIPETGNSQMYDILRNLLGKDAESEILVGDFNDKVLNINNLSLENFVDITDDNKAVFEMLFDAIGGYEKEGYTDQDGKPIYSKITVGDFAELTSFENVSLSVIIPDNEDNATLYDFLRSMVNKGAGEKLYINELKNIHSFENVKLSYLIDLPTAENGYANDDVYDILKSATGSESYESMTIGSLSNVNTRKITIGQVIPDDAYNTKIYSLLDCATAKYIESKKNDSNSYLYNPTGSAKTTKDLRFEDLNNAINYDDIKITNIITNEPTNKILKKLWEEDVTVGELGETIEAIELKEYLGFDYMKKVSVTQVYSSAKALYTYDQATRTYSIVQEDNVYNYSTNTYEYTSLNTEVDYYVINKKAGVWFLALTTDLVTEGVDKLDASTSYHYGAFKSIKDSGITLGDMDSLEVSNVETIKLKVFADLGLMSSIDTKLYDMTINDLMETIESL